MSSNCFTCGGVLSVGPSVFPGFDLLGCSTCDRPIKLIVKNRPRPASRSGRRGEWNRAMRAAQRAKRTRQ